MDEVHVLNVDTMRWSILPKSEGGPDASIPVKRSAHSSALVDGRYMFVFGGWDGNTELGDLSCYDLEQKTWSKPPCTGEAPVPRHFHNTVFMGRRMYIFGGYDGTNWRSDISALDVDSMIWELIKPSGDEAPGPRASGSCVIIGGNKILIFGGYNGEDFLQDLWILHTIDPITGQLSYRWEQLKEPSIPATTRSGIRIPMQPKPFWPLARSGHTADVFGPLVIILGGRHKNGRFNDIIVFNLDTFTWHEFVAGGEPFKARKTHAIGRIGNRLFLFGGHDGSNWMGDLHMLDLTGLAAQFSPKLSVYVPPTSLLHDFGSMVKDINLCVPKCSALSTSALAISTLRGGEGGPAGGIASAAFEEQEQRARQARSLLRRVYKRKDPKNKNFKKVDFPVNLNCTSLPYAVKSINDQEPLGVEVLNDTVDEDDFDEDDLDEESEMEKSKIEEDGLIMTDETEDVADGSMLSSSSSSAAVGGSFEEDERFSRNMPVRESVYPRRGVSYPLPSSTVSSSPFPLSSYENIFRERFGEKLGHNFLAPVSPPQQNISSSSSSFSIAADHLQDIVMSSKPVVVNTANTTSSSITSNTNTTIDSQMYTTSSPGGGCNHIFMGGSRNGGGASAMQMSTLHQLPVEMQNHLTTLTSKTLPLSQQIEQQKQQTTMSHIHDMYDAAAIPVSDPSHALFAAGLGTAASGFADVCFIVENRPISLHRCVLVARCEYFRAMFSSAFADANTRVIRLEDVELPVFEAAVRYIYTDQLPTADALDALCLPLLALAQRLGLKRLSSQCQRHLEGNVSVENAASMLETADMYGARPLRRACVNFITEHHTEVTCFMGSIIIDNLLSSVSSSTTTSSSSLSAKKKTLRSPGQSPGTASSLLAIAAAGGGGGTGILSLSSPSSGFVRQSMSISTTSNNAPLSLHSTRTSTSSSHLTTSSIHGDNERLLSRTELQRSVDPSLSLATSLQNDLLTSVVTSDTTLQKHLQYRSLLRAARSRDRDRLLTTGLTGLMPRTGRSSSREVGFTGNFEQETLQANSSQLAASGALSSSPGLFFHLDTHPYSHQHHNHSVSYPISPSCSTSALLESERRLAGVLDSGGGSVSSDLAMLRIQSPLSPSASITSSRPVGHTNSSWEPSINLSPSAIGESVVIRSQSTSIQGAGGAGELSFASKLAMVASSASQPPNRYSSSLAHSPSSSASASGVTSSRIIQPDDELTNKSPLSGSKRRRERETSTTTTTDGTGRGPLELASDDDEINISSMESQVNVGTGTSSSSGVGGGGGGGGGGNDNVSFFAEKGINIEKEDAMDGSSSAHSNSGKKRRQVEGEGSKI